MATGGPSGRPHHVSRSFDFGADDVLCSYDDIGNQDHSSGRRSDSAGKDFREGGRVGRPLVDVYSQREDSDNRDVLSAVDKCMKKYADNLLRYLEGISSRLSQLEHTCYDLERSVGDMRADLTRGQNESDVKLKSLEKHLQEVHRSVQILRDKQELAETQRELAKLQLAASKETSETPAATPEPSQQLALALPPKVAEAVPPVPSPYVYPQRTQVMPPMQQAPPPPQPPQQPQQPENPPPPPPPSYVQQWPHQQAPPPPQPSQLPQQPENPPPPPPPSYVQQWPHQQAPLPQQFSLPPAYQPGHDVYPSGPPLHAPPVGQNSYNPQQVSKPGSTGYGGGYYYTPPSQVARHGGSHPSAAPVNRGHPYAELIDKAVNMGYPRDHVFGAIRRMEETGQPIDFNSLLDLLNSRQRGWHG